MKKLKDRSHRIRYPLVIVLATVLLAGCPVFSDESELAYLRAKTKITNDAIAKSPVLQELDTVCSNIKLPEGFVFVSKGGLDDQAISLSYSYLSSMRFEKVKPIVEQNFDSRQWSIKDLSSQYPREIWYENNSYLIVFSYQEGSVSNYRFYCERLGR